MNQPTTFARSVAPWILGRQISVYLQGRPAPMTGLTVLQCQDQVLVARWNSSTHLIPTSAIVAIRFAPDADPCRDINHPLNSVVNRRRRPPPPKKSSPPSTDQRVAGVVSVGDLIRGLKLIPPEED
jgi:hypothetical protein